MMLDCPRCRTTTPEVARYCRHCGLPLEVGAKGVLGAGRARHPQPLSPERDASPIEGAADLYFHWQAIGGGTPLLGTESLGLDVFNGGHNLAEVVLRVQGEDNTGKRLFAVEREIESWPRGQWARLEIASYELPDPVSTLLVDLVKAEFGVQE